ncbi:hypothetical protein QFC21_001516 [Naganishia friedmannii]|uniref:Uncharacterized protein n=1 Tax=Naganishia friedmannii TaxID=89922 RepID=A0ACC2W4X4_9TREE|nr:hypothetical protein QFC21_001516 [Naganishia friedmannii]
MSSNSYELSTVLRAHSDDVKCVFPVNSDCILSASRDRTVAVWQREGISKEFQVKRLLTGHDGYVNSLEFVPADDDCQFDLIASAGNSNIILFHLFDVDPATYPSAEPVDGLVGHHANICALSYSRKHSKLVSASWDCAARVWSREVARKGGVEKAEGQRVKSKAGEWGCELVLSGHEAAVWGVAVLEGGSADRTLRMYDLEGTCVRKFAALPDAIRSISCFPDFLNVAVALNDGTIRIINVDDESSKTLENHTDYVYHVAVNQQNGDIISSGEDHTVAVRTNDEQTLQKLVHPCQSVWCCAWMPNGDIVSAGSDNAIRIWTTSEERKAEGEMLQVSPWSINRNSEGGQVSDSHLASTLWRDLTRDGRGARPGKEDGENVDGGDIVLDIMLEDDKAPLQLRFSKDSDRREVAETFGREHGLTGEEVEKVAAFLIDSSVN